MSEPIVKLTMKKLDADIKALTERVKALEDRKVVNLSTILERLEKLEAERDWPIQEIAKGLVGLGWKIRR